MEVKDVVVFVLSLHVALVSLSRPLRKCHGDASESCLTNAGYLGPNGCSIDLPPCLTGRGDVVCSCSKLKIDTSFDFSGGKGVGFK